ncbi:MAG: hypothetical protein KKH02_06945 [Proteobacteria bacterium]|nr:hypothetical protein [Pseudomonadota bacterium]
MDIQPQEVVFWNREKDPFIPGVSFPGSGDHLEEKSKMSHFRVSIVSALVLVSLLLVGCAIPTRPTATIPLPQDMKIVAPEPTLSPEIKAFSGKWFGVWDGILEHILVVEQINPPDATVIYAYGKAASWNTANPNFFRPQAQIEPGVLKLSTRRPAKVTYRLQSDGTLDATYEWSGGISSTKMKRLDQ